MNPRMLIIDSQCSPFLRRSVNLRTRKSKSELCAALLPQREPHTARELEKKGPPLRAGMRTLCTLLLAAYFSATLLMGFAVAAQAPQTHETNHFVLPTADEYYVVAQFNSFPPGAFLGHGPRDGAAVAGYQGPGDVIGSATAFYSCSRAYNAAYATATGNLCIIADAATGNTSTCTLVASTTGFVNLTGTYCGGSTPAAFCTAHTSCVVSTMYDQTAGNQCTASPTTCNIVQTTLANMPALTFSSLNSLPCVTMVAASALSTATPLNAIAAQPYTAAVVAKQTTTGSNPNIFGTGGGNPGQSYGSGGSVAQIFAGTLLTAAETDNAYHGLQFIANGASSGITVDSTATTGNAGTSAWGAGGNHIVLGGGTAMIGSFCEGGVWPIAFTAGNQSSWFSNANGSSGYNGGL
jgi:hypothetical protein